MSWDHKPDSNWLLWSDVRVVGTPKREIHPDRKACATASVVMLVRGNGFRPPGEAIHTCKQVGVALRGG